MLLKQFAQYRKGYSFGSKTFYNNFHVGVDYATPTGTPIYAHCNGLAKKVQSDIVGNAIHFTEPSGRLIRMLHLSSYEKLGEVKRGELMGYTGNTGLSTGAHIHIDVSLSGRYEQRNTNFVDPEKYFASISIAVVVKGGLEVNERLEAVANWYADHGIQINWLVVEEEANTIWEAGFIKREWLAKHIVPHASGLDMLLYITDNWQKPKSYGFALNEKILGVEVCYIKSQEIKDTRRRGVYNNDQLAATIRHEIMHSLYDMQGSPSNPSHNHVRGADNTHHYDYNGNDLAECFKKLRRDKMKGWNDLRVFRKAGWLTSTTPFSGNPTNKKIYRSSDNRMFFRYKDGWEIITEQSYNHYSGQQAKKGIISVKEANWIYKQLKQKPAEPHDYVVLEKLAKNKIDKLRLNAMGWNNDIPIWNY